MANALGLFPSRSSPEMLECAQTICEVAVKRTNAFRLVRSIEMIDYILLVF